MQQEKSYSQALKAISYNNFMENAQTDPVRKLIVERVAELKRQGEPVSLASLSKQLGLNPAYFQQFIKRHIPVTLPEDVRRGLAPKLGIPEEDLKGEGGRTKRRTPIKTAPHNARVGSTITLDLTVPAYGQAVGGRDGQFILADILAPASLRGVTGAYAVYVMGDSMEPRYFAGEAVFVNPGLPLRKGDFVVAQIAASAEGEAPHAYVKRFVALDQKRLRLEQYHPRKTLEFPADKVVTVHRIVMGGDG